MALFTLFNRLAFVFSIRKILPVLRNRFRWYGQAQRNSGWINEIKLKVGVSKGHPLKSWNEAVRNDKKAWNMEDLEPNDRLIWRKGIQFAIQCEWKK